LRCSPEHHIDLGLTMKRRFGPFVENITESTAACLVAMVQGNLLALSLSHWVIASRTGVIAGVVATTALLLARTNKRWVIAVVLGAITAGVDYFAHPAMFGPFAVEAVVTGLGAALLSYLVGAVIRRVRGAAPGTV